MTYEDSIKKDQLVSRVAIKHSVNDHSGFSMIDLIHRVGSPLDALMYAELFWPEFVEFEDMIFLSGTLETEDDQRRVKDTLAKVGQDRQEVERRFNIIEIPSLFGSHMGETTDREDECLTGRIAEMWACRLMQLYPSRKFVVEILEPDDGREIAILFYAVRVSR